MPPTITSKGIVVDSTVRRAMSLRDNKPASMNDPPEDRTDKNIQSWVLQSSRADGAACSEELRRIAALEMRV